MWGVLQEFLDPFNATVAKIVEMQQARLHGATSYEPQLEAVDLKRTISRTIKWLHSLILLCKAKPITGRIYLGIKTESVRKTWIQLKLWKELGFLSCLSDRLVVVPPRVLIQPSVANQLFD